MTFVSVKPSLQSIWNVHISDFFMKLIVRERGVNAERSQNGTGDWGVSKLRL